ncbi:FKBP-type peptidyl-prolyl cis-trans isomerase [Waddlia chondrophila]|uniref:peptidylprolyl isomerase n=1 Tax=Waddlia chondrophila (strain ATCC VR-1470 / WSU 86-1044) TaxID=716544 RepID=D6YST8_WADCW|nr:FKBP-type peptidyl-prolyl cis-trans isomerase [Waddlia chondrophila]ADI39133.1 putative peptidyl-prolyl cis-trans isomerase Mip precursor [Waddlia chondrophila WSU 86-1044]
MKNALCVSRLEELEDNVFSEETPPFKNLREVLNFPHLNVLDYICQRNHAKKARLLQPNLGYSTIQEEYQELIKNIRLSPEPLRSEHPRFIFGYFKDDPASLVLIEKLKESQKEIQKQLQTESFLKDCVRAFAGIDIIIDQDDSLAKALTAISKDQWNHLVSKRLCYTLMEEGYSLDDQQAFLEGFRETNATRELLDFRCAWPHFSENLQRALNNLKEANLFFSRLRNQAHLKELIPNSLFIESSENEADQKNDRASKVLLDYVVYNPKEEVLREVKGEAVLLSDTIPGFSQGVRQMRVGETARLYIHPSLAYGVETVSEQGIYLIADVTLRKVEEFLKDSAPLPIPKNLSYFLDPDWLSQSMEKRRLAMKDRGKELRCFFKKSPLLNMEEIESQMRMHLSDVSREVRITEREKELLNRLYWSICTKN